MTNEEAIETLKVAKAEIEWEYPMDYQIALDKAIKALEQELCEEQDICEKAYKDGYDKGWYDGFYIGKNRWVPVNVRMPKKEGEYLVTSRGELNILSFAKDLYKVDEYDFWDKKGVSGWFDYDSEYGYIETDGVTAWMPLPEKYKESEWVSYD